LTSSLAPKYSSPRLRPPPNALGWSGLVVHAAVDATEVAHRLEDEPQCTRARAERVEHAHFDVRVRVHCREHVVLAARIHVVHQQPNLDAAVGGLQRAVGKVAAGRVVVPDIGLDVETAACGPRRVGTDREGFRSFAHQAESGLARVLRLCSLNDRVEGRAGGERYRALLREFRPRRKAGAAREQQQDQGRRQADEAANAHSRRFRNDRGTTEDTRLRAC
jgi:hypothetical protein